MGAEIWNEMEYPDLKNRVHNSIRVGKVVEVDIPNYRARVKSGEIVSNWIPWGTQSASTDKLWIPCIVGEQVLLGCPGGDLKQAVIICKIFSDANSHNGGAGIGLRQTFSDGTIIEYNKAAHKYKITVGSSGTIEIEASGGITLKGDVSIEGNVSITKSVDVGQDVNAQGEITTLKAGAPINESTHIHPTAVGPTSSPTPGI